VTAIGRAGIWPLHRRHRRTRRQPAHGARGHLLPAGRQQGHQQRSADRGDRAASPARPVARLRARPRRVASCTYSEGCPRGSGGNAVDDFEDRGRTAARPARLPRLLARAGGSPVAWEAPTFTGYAGPPTPSTIDSRPSTLVDLSPEIGPEHIDFGPDGRLYTGVLSGAILRMNPDGTQVEAVVNTGGRPPRLRLRGGRRAHRRRRGPGPAGRDARRHGGRTRDDVDGDPIRYARCGGHRRGRRIVLHRTATRRFSPRDLGTFDASVLDILEHSCTGRVLVYEPARRARRSSSAAVLPEWSRALRRRAAPVHRRNRRVPHLKVDVAARGLDARSALASGDARARVIASNLPDSPTT